MSSERAGFGDKLTATYPASSTGGAWVGFYHTGAADNAYISYTYLSDAASS